MRLRELRNKHKLTQKEIAEKLGITQFTYSNYENLKTQPDIQILKDLANFYKVSLDYLLENDNNKGLIFIILVKQNKNVLDLFLH